MKRAPDSGIVGESALREAATTEMQQLIELVRASIRTAARLRENDWVDIHAIYPDRVVIRRDGRYYGYPYTITDDNQVTIGAAEEVVVEHKPVKAVATTVQLREGWFVEAVKGEGEDKPSRFVVRIIRSGLSKNGVNYPPKVLREAAPLFAGKQVFVKPDDLHIKGGGKDFDRLVGRLVEPRFVEASGEIQAVMEVLDSSSVAPKLREAVERGMTDLFGLSIDASGPSKSTGKFREATAITKVASVDLIIEPGAGGQVIRFAEAYQEPDMLRQQMLTTIKNHDAARAAALADASDEDVLSAYREAVAASQQSPNTGITQDQLQANNRLVEARADARAKVQICKLPQLAKDRLLTRFAEAVGAEELTAEKVDAAIKAEEDYGNTFRESAPVTGLGGRIEQGDEPRHVAIGKMLDGLFSGTGSVRSFREAYIEITGDHKVTGMMRDVDLGRFAESVGVFREAVSAATFSDVLGDSITRRMLQLYRDNPLYADWRDLVDVVPVRDFRTQERGRVGGYGNLPAVAENGPYDALTTPGDEKATYAISKRGGTETVSLEAIANDDVGALRRIPQLLATAAGRTLYEFVLGFIGTNPVIYDTVALFHATHANLGTAALDAASFAAARLRLQKQAELSSNKRLGLLLRHLYVPSDLEQVAYDLFVRNTNNDETFVQSQKPKVHVVPHWTDANNWYATADKSQIPLIELGFYGGNEDPELFVQDNPTQGSLFSNDQIKYKIRHIYGGAVTEYRGLDGSVVA